MTETDVRNYLERIYRLPVAAVRSAIHAGEMPLGRGRGYLVKKYDYRLCHVQLPKNLTFDHPGDDLFMLDGQSPDVEEVKEGMREVQSTEKKFLEKTQAVGQQAPTWWFTSTQ